MLTHVQTSLRVGAFTRCGAQLLAVDKNIPRISPVRAVLRARAFNRYDHANLHCVSCPTLSHQGYGITRLKTPILNLTCLWIFHIDVEPAMRVRPFDLRHRAGEVDGLLRVKLRRKQ